MSEYDTRGEVPVRIRRRPAPAMAAPPPDPRAEAQREKRRARYQANKERWFGEDRNARRRARYHSDPEYRRLILAREYAKTRPSPPKVTLAEIMARVAVCGQDRLVTWEGRWDEPRVLRTYSVTELANVLGLNSSVIYQWRSRGKLPWPVLVGARQSRGELPLLYGRPEVEAIARGYAEHAIGHRYLHRAHEASIRRIQAAVLAARGEMA